MIEIKQTKVPVLLVIFNRPDTTIQVFESIKKYQPNKLYVASDGARKEKTGEEEIVEQTRQLVLKNIDWECEVKTLFRDENIGCGRGVSEAISWMFETEEMGIILEDDCLPGTSFFPFCEELLFRFKNDEDIFLISGINMQNGQTRGDGSYYFSNYAITWGWATWRRAWKHFNYQPTNIDKHFKTGSLDHIFQNKPEKKYWYKKIKSTENLYQNIWDYQWFFSIWSHNGKGIIPNTNLVVNIGFSNNGTHTFLRDSIREPLISKSVSFPLTHPTKAIDKAADRYTYKNAFSHSITRLYRLAIENGIFSVIKYIFS